MEGAGSRLAGIPWRAEQGTEIKGRRGRDPTPEAAPVHCSGLRGQEDLAQGRGLAREGQEEPPGPEAGEGTLKMQFIRVTRVSKGGWPNRCMHDCVWGWVPRGAGEVPREPGPPSMGRVSRALSHPTAPKGRGDHEHRAVPTARLEREPLLVLEGGQGHRGAGPTSLTGWEPWATCLGCSQPRW